MRLSAPTKTQHPGAVPSDLTGSIWTWPDQPASDGEGHPHSPIAHCRHMSLCSHGRPSQTPDTPQHQVHCPALQLPFPPGGRPRCTQHHGNSALTVLPTSRPRPLTDHTNDWLSRDAQSRLHDGIAHPSPGHHLLILWDSSGPPAGAQPPWWVTAAPHCISSTKLGSLFCVSLAAASRAHGRPDTHKCLDDKAWSLRTGPQDPVFTHL